MYKTRMKQLGTRKNFKKEELAAVADILEIFVQAGLKTPTAIVNGQPIPIQRVKRYVGSLSANNPLRNSTNIRSSPGRAYLHTLKSFLDRHKLPNCDHPRRPTAMPRIFLKQSEDMHDLELALVQVNNYYGWRLQQSDDYFLPQMANTGRHADSDVATPVVFFDTTYHVCTAFESGVLHITQNAVRSLHNHAPLLLQQQRRDLPELLLYHWILNFGGNSHPAKQWIYSYLFSVAKIVLQESHPISMILKVIQSHETQQMSAWLLLNLMRDVTRRQEECDSMLVFEIEFDIGRALTEHEDFRTASEYWHSLLHRNVDEFGEEHESCRRVLFQIGFLNYVHYFTDQARKFWQRVLERDDAYIQGGEDISEGTLNALEGLARICEETQDLSGAEEWYLKAYNAACHVYGPEDAESLLRLHDLNQVRAKLREGREMAAVHSVGDKDVFEELEVEIARLQLLQAGEESGNPKLRAEPWNEWEEDVPDEEDNTNSPNPGPMEVATTTSKTLGEDDPQNPTQAEFTDTGDSTSPDTALIWDSTNDHGTWTEHGPSAHAQSLEGLQQGGIFEVFGEDGMDFMSTPLTDAHGLVNEAQAAFVPEKSADPLSLPTSGQDLSAASPYIGTLPNLNNDPDFEEFDNVGNAGDNFDVDPMMLDFDGGFSMFDLDFSDGVDLQAFHATEGQDLHGVQDFFAF
ncbi:uncharacterized protein PV07_10592 [Cladophialophora immunda]|uniref:Clr5 domain-containing protein n=1 Tax=Cladophialophora immunda TaxID=569365 RepID=A0A0D2C369_9EURO|nr:uncharacterized protein PV07_10592 [Cladophialophora immunda]KIW24910.1 hypothetical protein PV07_10592 [Cladophialophora immunda]